MPTSLVTGGAGFIGAHLSRYLVEQGHEVVILDDLSSGTPEAVPAGATLVTGSIVDDAVVRRLFAEHRIEFVYHLAAFASIGLSHYAKKTNYATNVLGAVNLIDAAVRHDVAAFVFASSTAVYGDLATPIRESDATEPVDSYGLAKLTVERELRLTYEHFGLRTVSLRLHNVYGEGQRLDDPYRNVVGILLNQVLRGEPISIYGDGRQTRAWTYVWDVVPVIARAATTPAAAGRAVNVGTDEVCSVLYLADLVRAATGRPEHPIRFLPARDEVTHLRTESAAGREVLGAWPQTPLAEGVRRTAAWAKNRGPHEWRYTDGLNFGDRPVPAWLRRNRLPAEEVTGRA